jgi:hypothetical protein
VPHRNHTIEYLGDLARECAKLAHQVKAHTLAECFKLAALEAATMMQPKSKSPE